MCLAACRTQAWFTSAIHMTFVAEVFPGYIGAAAIHPVMGAAGVLTFAGAFAFVLVGSVVLGIEALRLEPTFDVENLYIP
jgi:hypothetical protein